MRPCHGRTVLPSPVVSAGRRRGCLDHRGGRWRGVAVRRRQAVRAARRPARARPRRRRGPRGRATAWSSWCPPGDADAEGGVAGGATRERVGARRARRRAGRRRRSSACTTPPARSPRPQLFAARDRRGARRRRRRRPRRSPVTDTIKLVDADGVVVDTPTAATLVAVQTPQAFRAAVLRAAHAGGREGTDDAVARRAPRRPGRRRRRASRATARSPIPTTSSGPAQLAWPERRRGA